MTKRKLDVGREITRTVERLAEDAVERKLDSIGAEETGELIAQFDEDGSPIQKPDERVKGFFSSFPSAEGFYGKIYKLKTNGDWEIKDYIIESPESLREDPEVEIARIVYDKGWGPGKYAVRIFNYAKKKSLDERRVTVGELTREEKIERGISITPQDGPVKSPVDEALRIQGSILDTAVRLSPPQMDVGKVSEVISGALKSGIEAATKMMPVHPPQDGANNILQMMTAMMTFMKESGMLKQPDKEVNETAVMEKTISMMKDFGLLGAPKEGELSQLLKMKEVMGLKFAWEEKKEDPIESIGKLSNLVTALAPLIPGLNANPPSTVQLLIEHGPKLLEPLINTIRELAEAKKMETQMRLDNMGRGEMLPARRAETPSPAQRPPSPQPKGEPISTMNPIVSQIVSAIQKGDETFFPFIQQTIYAFIGPHVIEGLVDGELTIEYVLSIATPQLGNAISTPESKNYMNKFISWLREQAKIKEVVSGNGAIIGTCKMCGVKYTYDSEKVWSDESKICEECGGEIQRDNPSPGIA